MKPASLAMFIATRPYPDAIDARMVSAERQIAASTDASNDEYRVLRTGERKRYATDSVRRLKAKARRDELIAQGDCLNGAGHGKATHGRLCKGCRETHRRSA